jgi:hypothetical protein
MVRNHPIRQSHQRATEHLNNLTLASGWTSNWPIKVAPVPVLSAVATIIICSMKFVYCISIA